MTYSLANTGATVSPQGRMADNPTLPLNRQISDNVVNSPSAEQNAMMTGLPFLVKQPDGSEAFYRFDTERSIPGVLRILLRV